MVDLLLELSIGGLEGLGGLVQVQSSFSVVYFVNLEGFSGFGIWLWCC